MEEVNTFLKSGTVFDAKAAQEAIHLLEAAQAEADFERSVRVRDAIKRQFEHHFKRLGGMPNAEVSKIEGESFQGYAVMRNHFRHELEYYLHAAKVIIEGAKVKTL